MRSPTAVSLSVFQVDPLFTVPAPPPPIASSLTPQLLPSYFSPSSSSIAAPVEQLLVRTRSVGVNTCEVGVVMSSRGATDQSLGSGVALFPRQGITLKLSVRITNREKCL